MTHRGPRDHATKEALVRGLSTEYRRGNLGLAEHHSGRRGKGAASAHDGANGPHKNLEIEQSRAAVQVLRVEPELRRQDLRRYR